MNIVYLIGLLLAFFFVFFGIMVDVNADKTQIKEAVELAFGVKVAKVNTIRMQGKVKRTGAYPAGKRADYKKAIVTLTADSKTIEFFEGMV